MITRIEKDTTHKKKYRIYVDGEPLFSIHEDILVKFHIHKGLVCDEVQLKQWIEEEEKNTIRQAAYQYLSYKPRTIYEVRQYLLRKKGNEIYIEATLLELIEKGYLNDQQYAQQWTQDKQKIKGWGYYRLKEELTKKGIAAKWIDQVLDEIKEDEYSIAFEKAKKRFQRLYNEPWIKVERKLGPYLLREGFSQDIVYKILKQLRLSHRECEN